LDFGGAEVTFGLVGGRGHLEVVGEAQHVVGAVAQDFQQQSGFAFPGAGAVGEGVGQPDQHSVAEPGEQRDADVGGDRGPALFAGEVGRTDQLALRVGDLGRPHGVG
jgi:hypothetical protein